MARKLPWTRVVLLYLLLGIAANIALAWLMADVPDGVILNPRRLAENPQYLLDHFGPRLGWVVYALIAVPYWSLVAALAVVVLAGMIFLIPAYLVWRLVFVPYVGLTYAISTAPATTWFETAQHWLINIGAASILGLALLASMTWWPRVLSFLGLWDPFWAAHRRPKRWFLQGMSRFKEWRESRQFGKGASAGWAGLIEVMSHGYRAGDIFLGRPKLFIGGMMRPVGIPTEKHMVTIAGTGSGKSSGALIPNLCLHEGSLLCIDPKGELATVTTYRRWIGLAQECWILDPHTIVPNWGSASYNVFDELAAVAEEDDEIPVTYAGKIAEALVKNVSEKEPYWDNASKTLIRGLVLYIFVHESPEKRNLPRLRQLLLEGDVEAYNAAVAGGVIKADSLTPFDVLLEKMKAARDGLYGQVIAGTALSIERMGANQLGGVLTNAQEHTVFLDAPEIQRVSLSSDFLLADLKRKPMSVYLCLPLNAVSGKEGAWLRMFVVLLVDMMSRAREVPKPPILLAIDEFPSLGHLEGIETVAPTLRSQGVRLWVIGQDIEQFQKVYPKSWGGFLGGAEAVQFMGITHKETVEYIAALLGRHTVVTDKWNDGQRTREVRDEKPLLDADQVARLLSRKKKNQIIWRGESKPLLLKTTPYFKYLAWWYYDADPRHPEQWARRFFRWWKSGERYVSDTPASGAPVKQEEAGV